MLAKGDKRRYFKVDKESLLNFLNVNHLIFIRLKVEKVAALSVSFERQIFSSDAAT